MSDLNSEHVGRDFGLALANATADALEPVFRAILSTVKTIAEAHDGLAKRVTELELEAVTDHGRRTAELERRVAELEKARPR